MARPATTFVCSDCGHAEARWRGQCPGCEAWNTLVEERVPAASRAAGAGRANGRGGAVAPRPVPLREVRAERTPRLSTGVGELDRVLGGGLVPGSLVLLGGSPGIGKSTLTGMALGHLVGAGRRVVYVSGEESAAQIRLRHERLARGAAPAALDVPVLAETDLDAVLAALEAERPEACVIDSVQTLHASELSGAPGSVGQVREVAARIMAVAKRSGTAVVLVGHVTKEGSLAGPRVLEHLVDCVAAVRGRARADVPHDPRAEEPLRLHERGRRLRDARRGARRGPRRQRPLRRRGHAGARQRGPRLDGGLAAAARGGPGPRLAQRARAPAARRPPGSTATASRSCSRSSAATPGSAWGRPTCSSTSSAACGSTSRAPTSRSRSPSPARRAGVAPAATARRWRASARSASPASCARSPIPTARAEEAAKFGLRDARDPGVRADAAPGRPRGPGPGARAGAGSRRVARTRGGQQSPMVFRAVAPVLLAFLALAAPAAAQDQAVQDAVTSLRSDEVYVDPGVAIDPAGRPGAPRRAGDRREAARPGLHRRAARRRRRRGRRRVRRRRGGGDRPRPRPPGIYARGRRHRPPGRAARPPARPRRAREARARRDQRPPRRPAARDGSGAILTDFVGRVAAARAAAAARRARAAAAAAARATGSAGPARACSPAPAASSPSPARVGGAARRPPRSRTCGRRRATTSSRSATTSARSTSPSSSATPTPRAREALGVALERYDQAETALDRARRPEDFAPITAGAGGGSLRDGGREVAAGGPRAARAPAAVLLRPAPRPVGRGRRVDAARRAAAARPRLPGRRRADRRGPGAHARAR